MIIVCSGGLVYSHDLQTCDWPRNVACQSVAPEVEEVEVEEEPENTNIIVTDSKKVNIICSIVMISALCVRMSRPTAAACPGSRVDTLEGS